MAINRTMYELATEPDPERRLTGLEYRLRDLLMSCADDDGVVRVKTVELAELVHAKQPTVSTALRKLAKLNLITKKSNGVYVVNARTARSRTEANDIRKEIAARAEAAGVRRHLKAVQ
jgi:DNA-binding MarR family transcriptional regulator